MGTNMIRAMLLASASLAVAAASMPTAAYAQDASYQIDIPAQSLGSALRALGRATKRNILFDEALVRGKQSAPVRGRMNASEALSRMLAGSGLTMSTNARGLVVQAGNGGAAARGERGEAEVSGTVLDATTGRRLVGALVRVGRQSAVTDEQGQYRITRVPPGVAVVTVSFIGMDAQEQQVDVSGSGVATVDFALGAEKEIIVYGTRSARSLALNRERAAPNSSTVISADLLGDFQGATLSEALRRAPGVAFQQNEATGDGTNIIVRGMSPDYNQVKLNGLGLPETSGTGRAPNLGPILADSVSEIKISKTLLPSQDGSGTGGLVEIETKSPLDRGRRYASFGIEGTKRGKGYGEDFLVSGTLSGRFGPAQQFGLSASVQYRKQDITTYNYSLPTGAARFGPYLPLNEFGRPMQLADIDPRTPFPFGSGADGFYPNSMSNTVRNTVVKTYAVNLAAEWQPSVGTNLKLDYVRTGQTRDTFDQTLLLNGRGNYALLPVSTLGGQQRYTVQDTLFSVGSTINAGFSDNQTDITDNISFRGETKTGPWTLKYRAGYANGRTEVPLDVRTSLIVQGSSFSQPGLLLPEAIDPQTGFVSTIFGRRDGRGYPLPLFTAAGFDRINNPAMTRFGSTGISKNRTGSNTVLTAGGDVQRDFAGDMLKYIQFGGEYSKARFRNRASDYVVYFGQDENFIPPSATIFSLQYEDITFANISNRSGRLRFATPDTLRGIPGQLDRIVAEGLGVRSEDPADPLNGRDYTNEDKIAAYVEGRIDVGKLQIFGGVRLARVRVNAGVASGAFYYDLDGNPDPALENASRLIVDKTATQTNVLPRILINYRPQENLIFRAGYFSTVAQPQIQLLSSAQIVSLQIAPLFGPNRDQPTLTVSQGNPNLRPAVTQNFDVSAEWYSGSVGVLKTSFFYKRIRNLLESTVTNPADLSGVILPNDPRFQNLPSNTFVQVLQPINNPDAAKIWGVELALERQFDFLPGALSGLGVYANYTYTHSEKSERRTWGSKPVYNAAGNVVTRVTEQYVLQDIPFNQSPAHSGTASLTYNKYGFDASLSYSFQARRLLSIGDYKLNSYNEAVSTLDLRAEYRFKVAGANARLFMEGANLLKGAKDADVERSVGGIDGVPKFYTDGFYRGGRSFTVGVSANF